MTDIEKDKLRDMSTRLLGMEMRLKVLADTIHMEMHKITMERNAIHNLTEKLPQDD